MSLSNARARIRTPKRDARSLHDRPAQASCPVPLRPTPSVIETVLRAKLMPLKSFAGFYQAKDGHSVGLLNDPRAKHFIRLMHELVKTAYLHTRQRDERADLKAAP